MNWKLILGLGVALSLRLGFAWEHAAPLAPGGDSVSYLEAARNLGTSRPLTLDHPPIYPVFLRLWRPLWGNHFQGILMIQAVLGVLAAWGIYGLTQSLGYPQATALGAVSWIALDPFQIYFSSVILSETLFTFLLVFFIWAWSVSRARSSIAYACLAGCLFGATALTRSVMLPFLPFFGLGFFFSASAWRRRILLMLLFTAAACLPMASWTVYVRQLTGQTITVSVQKGWNSYEGLNEHFDTEEGILVWQAQMIKEVREQQLPDRVAIDRYFWGKTLRTFRREPLRVAHLMARKLLKFWRPWPYFPYSKLQRIISAIFMLPLYTYGFLGLWKASRRPGSREGVVAIFLFVALYGLLNMLTWTQIRYRIPLHPFLALFAALGATL